MATVDPIDGGWILLSDKILESDVFKGDPARLRLWTYLMLKATRWNRTRRECDVVLECGQLRTSLRKLESGLRSETKKGFGRYRAPHMTTIRRWLKDFEDEHMLRIETLGQDGLLITLENFPYYQDLANYLSGRSHSCNTFRNAFRNTQDGDSCNTPGRLDTPDITDDKQGMPPVDATPDPADCATTSATTSAPVVQHNDTEVTVDPQVTVVDPESDRLGDHRRLSAHPLPRHPSRSKRDTRAIVWDPETCTIVWPSERRHEQERRLWAREGKDLDSEVPLFEDYHRRMKTEMKSPGGALATWRKKARRRLGDATLPIRARDAFRELYTGAYGLPPKWEEKRHAEKLDGIIGYLKDCAEALGRESLNDEQLLEGFRRVARKYLKDRDGFVVQNRHSFSVFAARFELYVPMPKGRK